MPVDFSVTNQLASPAIYASSFATRPAASFKGRLFVDTNVPSTGIYRDTGTAWVAIAGTGVAETQNLESVCQIGNTSTTGVLVTGQSAFGEFNDEPISPIGDYAVTIGEKNSETPGNSLFVKFTALFEKDIYVNNLTVGNGGGNDVSNTVFGNSAFVLNTVGIRNTAIGVNALKDCDGNENTSIGYRSLENLTIGYYNTGIGSAIGANVQDGNGNTLIGYGTNITAVDDNYNVVIGYLATAPLGSNQFVVGNATENAGAVTNEVNASTKVWNVVINGVARKILLA